MTDQLMPHGFYVDDAAKFVEWLTQQTGDEMERVPRNQLLAVARYTGIPIFESKHIPLDCGIYIDQHGQLVCRWGDNWPEPQEEQQGE